MKAHPGQTPDENAINGQVYQNFYDQAFNATGLGTGGAVQQGIQAATAAIQGLAGGDIAAAIANGSAPYLAEAIGHRMGIDDNPEAKTVAHAIVGAALAAAQGQNAAAGATGAALGEITAGILKDQLYGDTPVADLTETQKQTLSALATLSSGLAGGLVGDSTGSAVYAAQAGKTTAENNLLNGMDAQEKNSIELALSETGLALHPRTPQEIAALEERHEQLTQLDTDVDKYVQDACSQGRASPACQDANALAQGLQGSYNDYLGRLTYKELNSEDYAKVSQIVANTSADKWDYAIEGYAKSQNISYQEAKDRFALAININQAADIAGILYGLKGSSGGTLSASAASTLKQVLSKYNEFKQNIVSSTKGNNDTLAMAGAGNVNGSSTGSGLSSNAHLSTGSNGKGKQSYQPNQGAVGNMGEFFKQPGFGEVTRENSQKTSKIYQGQTVYKASSDSGSNIRKGDQFYLDAEHKNHLEVFDKRNKFVHVLNLDGSINFDKTKKAAAEGRTLPK